MANEVLSTKSKMLPVSLKPPELAAKATALAHALGRADEIADEKKRFAATLKERTDAVKAEVTKLAKALRERAEDREVEVVTTLTDREGMVQDVRTDTNEVIATRRITNEEAQHPLFDAADGDFDDKADA